MASNVTLNAGTGGAVAATAQVTHDGDTAQLQLIGLMGISGTEDAYTVAKINGDATNGLDVDVTRLIPGTTATALGKAEDDAHASGDVGVAALAVRRDAAAVGSGIDGDYSTMNVDASGRLWVNGSGVTQPVSGTVTANLAAGVNNIGDVDVLTLPALPAGTNNIGDVDVLTLPALPAGTNNIGDVDVLTLPALAAGTNNIGDVDVLTVPADPFGANADAASATGSISAKLRFIAVTGIPITSIAAGDNNIGNVDVVTLPGAAHDAAISGNPVRVAGRGMSADYTATTTGDTADLLASLLGKLVTLPYALPGASWSYASPAAVTDTADDVVIAAGGAGVRHYITGVQVFNGHDTVGTEVVIKDGATVLWRGWAEQTGGGCSAKFDPPLRGTAATAVNVANITTGSSTYFNLQGYSAAE